MLNHTKRPGIIDHSSRKSVHGHVNYTQERGESGEGELINLSIGGCAIRNTSGTPVNNPMYISLRLAFDPQTPPVMIEMGKVRWASSTEFGVEFLLLPHAERTRLQRYLRSAIPSASAA